MTNDDILTEAIQLIRSGKKDAARALLEPFLLKNPNHIQAWMWEAELFPNDRDKIRILEACLKHNPGHPQVIQALTFLKRRSGANIQPAMPVPTPPPVPGPPSVKPPPSSSSFSTSSFLPDPVVSASTPRPTAADSAAAEAPRRPKPSPPQNPGRRKAKRMTPKMMQAIVVMMVCIAVLFAIGSYLGGGYYLNGQINEAFAMQNCAGVIQHAVFVSAYPEGIFGSMFTGHDRYFECRIKLDVEQAAAAKNWGKALSRAQEYSATYPNGSFAESMREQAPNILFSWSQELIASQDYGNGIEKLKQLVETYPGSPPAQPAPDAILQSYILWAKDLTGQQNYAEAEQRLNAAFSYFQADPARSEQIKQELIILHVDWGDMQIRLGDMDNGITHYTKAGEISPGKIDVELLIARAYLQRAIYYAETENFDRALAEVGEISDAAQTDHVKSEANAAREQILAAYSVSTSQQALDQMTAAINLTCQGQRPELPIFGLDAEKVRFGLINFYMKLPADWAAERPSELHYVVCISESDEELETCRYTGNHYLVRMRYLWQVTLYDILTGAEHDSKTFRGSAPGECPPRANFGINSPTSRSFGKRPTADEILGWLEELNLTK